MEHEAVIGLEVHCQLLTASKIFCCCSARFGDPPNSNVCPVCLGMPGVLPVLNRRALDFALRNILVEIGVTDGNMEEGSLRCDANVSLRPKGRAALGTKAELKNLNSFKFVQHALEYEIERQAGVLDAGGKVVQETRLYNP